MKVNKAIIKDAEERYGIKAVNLSQTELIQHLEEHLSESEVIAFILKHGEELRFLGCKKLNKKAK